MKLRRKRIAFNACERCGRPLHRHPDHLWRYDEDCRSCGFVQSWGKRKEEPSGR